MASTKPPKPAPKPSTKTLKSFFKLISLDLLPKVKAELAKGLDPNVQFDVGYGEMPALSYAIGMRHYTSARALLDGGADVTVKDKRGETALHDVDDVKLAKELVQRGADVNAKSKVGRTPLHEAAAQDRPAIVELLIGKGAAVDAKDHEGKTPYALASDAGVRALLKKHGAKGFGPGGGSILSPKRGKAKLSDIDAERGALGVDAEGRVWIGGYQGLFRIDGDVVTRFRFEESFAVDSIAQGPKGVVYLATNWGLLQFANDTFRLYRSDDSELFDNHLTCMATNAKGHAYLIAYEGEAEEKHVTVFDGKTFEILSPGVELPRKLLDVSSIGFDAKGGVVLGFDGGIAFERAGKWTVTKKLGKASDVRVHAIATTKDGWWLGTSHSWLIEYRGGKFVAHEMPESVNTVCLDGDTVWVGMSYGGLGRFVDGELTVIKAEGSELPDDDVERLVRAPDGTIWIHAGGKIAYLRDGVVHGLVAKPAPKPEKPEKPKKLVPFPKQPLIASLPADVSAAIAATALVGIAHADLVKLVRPAIAFDVTKGKDVPVGASKFGGRPDLPASVAWPAYDHDEDRMLPFILQINLAEAHALDGEGLLPDHGMLYVFSDTAPDEISGSRVLYTAETALARRAFPEDLVDRKAETDFIAQVPEHALALFPLYTVPSIELLRRRAALTDADEQALHDLKARLVELAHAGLARECSRLLGWPDSVQSEVVDSERQIALLQLNGHGLSGKAVNRIFDHWCSDGLIHVVLDHQALAKRQFDKAAAEMSYT